MAGVSNADIMQAIIKVEGDVSSVREITLATKAQAEKTNGRVTKIEEWKNALQAIEQYKKEQTPTVKTEQGDVIVQAQAAVLDAKTKAWIAFGGAASVIAAAIAGFLSGGGGA